MINRSVHQAFAFVLLALGGIALLTSVVSFSLPAFVASLFLLSGGGNTLLLYQKTERLEAQRTELKEQLERIESRLELMTEKDLYAA